VKLARLLQWRFLGACSRPHLGRRRRRAVRRRARRRRSCRGWAHAGARGGQRSCLNRTSGWRRSFGLGGSLFRRRPRIWRGARIRLTAARRAQLEVMRPALRSILAVSWRRRRLPRLLGGCLLEGRLLARRLVAAHPLWRRFCLVLTGAAAGLCHLLVCRGSVYYANNLYYTWSPDYNGYVATDPRPSQIRAARGGTRCAFRECRPQRLRGAPQPLPDATGPSRPPRVRKAIACSYTESRASTEQQRTDKLECEKWASDEVGLGSNGPDYQRAMAACLQGRGYGVN